MIIIGIIVIFVVWVIISMQLLYVVPYCNSMLNTIGLIKGISVRSILTVGSSQIGTLYFSPYKNSHVFTEQEALKWKLIIFIIGIYYQLIVISILQADFYQKKQEIETVRKLSKANTLPEGNFIGGNKNVVPIQLRKRTNEN